MLLGLFCRTSSRNLVALAFCQRPVPSHQPIILKVPHSSRPLQRVGSYKQIPNISSLNSQLLTPNSHPVFTRHSPLPHPTSSNPLPHLKRIHFPQIISFQHRLRTISMMFPERNPALIVHCRFQQHRLHSLKLKMLFHLLNSRDPNPDRRFPGATSSVIMCASGGFSSARINPTICFPSSATRQSAAGKLKKYCSDHLLYAIPGGKQLWSSLYKAAKSRPSYPRIFIFKLQQRAAAFANQTQPPCSRACPVPLAICNAGFVALALCQRRPYANAFAPSSNHAKCSQPTQNRKGNKPTKGHSTKHPVIPNGVREVRNPSSIPTSPPIPCCSWVL